MQHLHSAKIHAVKVWLGTTPVLREFSSEKLLNAFIALPAGHTSGIVHAHVHISACICRYEYIYTHSNI